MRVNRLSVCVLVLVIAKVTAGPPSAPAPLSPDDPRLFPNVTDPNDPGKTRPTVSQEKREELGLKPKTWSGVVDPEVYARLDRLNDTIAKLKEKVKNERDERAFRTLSFIRFEGMVYVQVQSKSEPKIPDVHHRVLGDLRASEFHALQLFKEAPGFIGYATKEGLDKLAKHPDVTGVCLDDKPLPRKAPQTVGKHPELGEEPWAPSDDDRVEPQVRAALETKADGYVFVILSLKRDVPRGLAWAEKKEAARKTQDRVLTALTADEFQLSTRSLGSALYGYINVRGLEKIAKHPDVVAVQLTRAYTTQNGKGRSDANAPPSRLRSSHR